MSKHALGGKRRISGKREVAFVCVTASFREQQYREIADMEFTLGGNNSLAYDPKA